MELDIKATPKTEMARRPLSRTRQFLFHAYWNGPRRLLPEGAPVLYAGIPIRMTRKFGDLKIPPLAKRLRDIPEYEDALVTGLRRHALAGDRVVIVGGGWGVTAVIAALAIGESGSVVCFEGAEDNVEKVRWAASRSGVADRLNVMHAVVGASIQVYSEGVEGTLFEPEDLPECDLLQLDCEGAEIPILMRMKIRPRAVIVETHGFLGSSTNTVERLLVDLGYRIVTKTVAESSLETMCVDRDVFVVVGLKE